MGELFKPGWGNRLKGRLNSSLDFQSAAKSFDGSVLLKIGDETVWLKIYSGHVIDVRHKPSPFGFTFALGAPEKIWETLLQDSRNEILSFTGSGRILVEGNLFEFMRLTKTVVELVEGMRVLFRGNASE